MPAKVDPTAATGLAWELDPQNGTPDAAPALQMWAEAVLVPMDWVVLNSWNPNEQQGATFSALVEEIRTDGFDGPILVVEIEARDGHPMFRVVDGEHRYKAARALNLSHIPSVVKRNWTAESDQRIKTVRRNNLRGSNNPTKFDALVRVLVDREKIPLEVLPERMGFPSREAFEFLYKDRTANTRARAEPTVRQEAVPVVHKCPECSHKFTPNRDTRVKDAAGE